MDYHGMLIPFQQSFLVGSPKQRFWLRNAATQAATWGPTSRLWKADVAQFKYRQQAEGWIG